MSIPTFGSLPHWFLPLLSSWSALPTPGGPVGPLCSGPQTVLPFLPRVSEAQNTLLGHWVPSCLNPSHPVLCWAILRQLCLSILSSLPSITALPSPTLLPEFYNVSCLVLCSQCLPVGDAALISSPKASSDPISPLFKDLRWFPIIHRIYFRCLSLAFTICSPTTCGSQTCSFSITQDLVRNAESRAS